MTPRANHHRARLLAGAPAVLASLALTGCATRTHLREEVLQSQQTLSSRIAILEARVEENRASTANLAEIAVRHEAELADSSETAGRALQQALEARELVQGRFVAEVVATEDGIRFPLGSAALGDTAAAALDLFASQLILRNDDVHLEIHGHTDSSGGERLNQELGLRRAEMVMRYLHEKHGIPLHRMNVLTYGEHVPIADNGSASGRAANRRVTLVVLS